MDTWLKARGPTVKIALQIDDLRFLDGVGKGIRGHYREDIITDLSKVGGLMVIARNSSFGYKGPRQGWPPGLISSDALSGLAFV